MTADGAQRVEEMPMRRVSIAALDQRYGASVRAMDIIIQQG